MLRERHKWRSHEADIIDAASRGGAARSSVEASVMEAEQRGSRDQRTLTTGNGMINQVQEDGGSLRDLWEPSDARVSRSVLRGAGLKCLVYSP